MAQDHPSTPVGKGTRSEIFAWAMYDWANSAYSTLLITIVLFYIQEIVLPGRLGLAVYAWVISVAMFSAAVLSPIVGALADANRSKRKWLAGTALGGSAAALAMAVPPPEQVWPILIAFVVMSTLFDLSLVPYNGFLPEISDESTINRVSARGYALGYLGGSIPLVIAGLIVIHGKTLGLASEADQYRAGIVLLGLWWAVFTLPAVFILKDRGRPLGRRQPILPAVRSAFRKVGHTLASVRIYPVLSLFLLGFLFYNDGIQTVITQANTLAREELEFDLIELFWLVLMIQLVALPGALLVGYLSDRLGQKPILLCCLAVWVGLLVAAMFVGSKQQFWIMGVVLGLVLGGTQSVSRAIMGLITPPGHTAEFFGFFNLSGKAASFLGPAQFGLIIWLTGNARLATLSLLIFFLIGWAIVAWINIDQGRRQALEA